MGYTLILYENKGKDFWANLYLTAERITNSSLSIKKCRLVSILT